jgi:hypothetical protein
MAGLNVKGKTIKLLEDNTENIFVMWGMVIEGTGKRETVER